MEIKKIDNIGIGEISSKTIEPKSFGQVVCMASSVVLNQAAVISQSVPTIARKIEAEIVVDGPKILLKKEINDKIWTVLAIDNEKDTIDVVVDIKTPGKPSITTGITADDIQVPGYILRQVHEVRGPLAWLLDTDMKGREITTRQGARIFVEMVLEELTLRNGDIVRHNTWDFRPHALYATRLSENIILCESPEHKRNFILQLADDYCAGKIDMEDKFSPEIKEQLRKINETQKAPAYLSGYEIHHDGYGNMLLLPKEIHCRKLAHIGGSWLMNTQNYAINIIENPGLDESVCKILLEELTADKIKSYNDFTIEEKECFISSIGDQILCNAGLSDVKIEFSDNLKSTTCGQLYNDGRIVLNRELLKNPNDALHTELHEIRHAVQHDAVEHPKKYGFDAQTIEKWRDNIAHYISPILDYEAYILQPIETDAEIWASEMLHNLKNSIYV